MLDPDPGACCSLSLLDVLFDDEGAVTRDGRMILDLAASAINVHRDHRVEVVAYGAPLEEASREVLWQASFDAARQTVGWLADEFAVPEHRLVVSAGSYQHAADTETAARVEIRVTPPVTAN